MAQDHAAKAVKGGDRACWGCGAGGDSVKPRTHRTGDSHPLIDVRQTSAFRPASRLRRGYSNHIHHCIVLSAPPPPLSLRTLFLNTSLQSVLSPVHKENISLTAELI